MPSYVEDSNVMAMIASIDNEFLCLFGFSALGLISIAYVLFGLPLIGNRPSRIYGQNSMYKNCYNNCQKLLILIC